MKTRWLISLICYDMITARCTSRKRVPWNNSEGTCSRIHSRAPFNGSIHTLQWWLRAESCNCLKHAKGTEGAMAECSFCRHLAVYGRAERNNRQQTTTQGNQVVTSFLEEASHSRNLLVSSLRHQAGNTEVMITKLVQWVTLSCIQMKNLISSDWTGQANCALK